MGRINTEYKRMGGVSILKARLQRRLQEIDPAVLAGQTDLKWVSKVHVTMDIGKS